MIDKQSLDRIKKATSSLIGSLRDMEALCGNGPIGLRAKSELKNQIAIHKRLLYGVIYGEEPPFELPDNWGEQP